MAALLGFLLKIWFDTEGGILQNILQNILQIKFANTNNPLIFGQNLKAMIETMLEIEAPVALSDYEIERGKPMPDKNHAIIQSNLLFSLRVTTRGRFSILSEINLDLPKRERVPDLAIYEPLVFDPNVNEIRMLKPPVCAIEILSEMQSIHELMKKSSEYFAAGISSYWLVLPALETIYVFHSLKDRHVFSGKDRLVDKVLNIELDLSDIFANP